MFKNLSKINSECLQCDVRFVVVVGPPLFGMCIVWSGRGLWWEMWDSGNCVFFFVRSSDRFDRVGSLGKRESYRWAFLVFVLNEIMFRTGLFSGVVSIKIKQQIGRKNNRTRRIKMPTTFSIHSSRLEINKNSNHSPIKTKQYVDIRTSAKCKSDINI